MFVHGETFPDVVSWLTLTCSVTECPRRLPDGTFALFLVLYSFLSDNMNVREKNWFMIRYLTECGRCYKLNHWGTAPVTTFWSSTTLKFTLSDLIVSDVVTISGWMNTWLRWQTVIHSFYVYVFLSSGGKHDARLWGNVSLWWVMLCYEQFCGLGTDVESVRVCVCNKQILWGFIIFEGSSIAVVEMLTSDLCPVVCLFLCLTITQDTWLVLSLPSSSSSASLWSSSSSLGWFGINAGDRGQSRCQPVNKLHACLKLV